MSQERPFNPRVLVGLGVGLCVLVTGIVVAAILFLQQQADETEKSVRQKTGRVNVLQKDVARLQSMIVYYQEERKELEGLLFTQEDISAFLRTIGDYAKKSEVKIAEMKAQDSKQIKESDSGLSQKKQPMLDKPKDPALAAKKTDVSEMGIMYLPLKMTVEGPFDRILSFLVSLEGYRQILTLTEVSLKRTSYPVLRCDFTMQLYSLKPASAVVK